MRNRSSVIAIAIAAALMAPVGAAQASSEPPPPFDPWLEETLPAPLSPEQLDAQRGGLLIPPLGIELGFGAVVRTFVDGQLALETQLTWTSQGPVSAVLGGLPLAQLNATGVGGLIEMGDLANWNGLILAGDGGTTALLHNLSRDQIASVVLNSASNRDIRQETAITLNIPGLEQMQQAFQMQAVDLRLQDSVGAALITAAGH